MIKINFRVLVLVLLGLFLSFNIQLFSQTKTKKDTLKKKDVKEKPKYKCGEPIKDARDGKQYKTVLIGEQCWMAENLNVGTMITSYKDETNNNLIEKLCYDNDSANCKTFGGLYEWNEMMQYRMGEKSKGICPDEWHVPSDAEWFILERTLDPSFSNQSATGWRGKDIGKNLKVGGSSGFNGLLAGGLSAYHMFKDLNNYGYFWTSTAFDNTNYIRRDLCTLYPTINRVYDGKTVAYSVRCIKD